MRMVLLLMCTIITSVAAADEAREWRRLPLIEGDKVHPNWKMVGWGAMEVDGDALATRPDPRGLGLLVYASEKFGDCQIQVVYRPEKSSSNAGVFVRVDEGILDRVDKPSPPIRREAGGELTPEMLQLLQRASDEGAGAWYAVHHGYEVQICDAADPIHRTGAVYSLAPSSFQPPNEPDGAWRTMTITLDGDIIHVDHDGQRIMTFDASQPQPSEREWYEPKREPRRPRAGYIGLQTHDPGDTVWFREIRVRPLERH